ncbi:MAG: shikimate dehydrogenase family protein [Candidatus Puniceispirillaceae bacterium]
MSATASILRQITGTTALYGTIAHPSDHVRAPMLFNKIFQEKQLDKVMVPIDVSPDNLAATVAGLRAMGNFKGLAVTIPHKLALASLCDELGLAAQITGAVNAVRFDEDGRLYGDNFDGHGFVAGLKGEGRQIAGKNIVLMGAGGAARAIALSLAQSEIESLVIANRTPEKATEILTQISPHAGTTQLSDCAANEVDLSAADIVINATSLGLHEGDRLPFKLDLLKPSCLVCDIIMIPAETALLQQARSRGFEIQYGRHMLDYQLDLIARFIGAYE